jgi:hypothetical protein
MGRKGIEVVVSEPEREQLLSMGRSRSLPHSLAGCRQCLCRCA